MRSLLVCIIMAFVILYCTGCKKDDSSNPQSISGNWNFIGLRATTSTIYTYNDAGVMSSNITTSRYTASEYSGSVKISGSTLTGDSIKYYAQDTVLFMQYDDNEVVDSLQQIEYISTPPVSSVSNFEQIGSDSLHFTDQPLLSAGDGPAATGAKFSITGNIMTLTTNMVNNQNNNSGGVAITMHQTANVVVLLQRQ